MSEPEYVLATKAMFAEISGKPGPSLWWHLGRIRGEDQPEDKTGWFAMPVSL